jgi:hypothetical protein
MREVVARLLWQLLWPSENGSFGWSWERNFKVRGGDGLLLLFFFFFFCKDRENFRASYVPSF